MALPTTPTDSWTQSLDFPSRLFGTGFGGNDYELYEQDGEFVLTIEMPGFDPEEITLAWDDGVLNVAGEHTDESRNRRKTYHRRFRFPKDIDDDAITAELLSTRLGAAFLERRGLAGDDPLHEEVDEHVEEAREGDVHVLGSLDRRFAFGDEPGDRQEREKAADHPLYHVDLHAMARDLGPAPRQNSMPACALTPARNGWRTMVISVTRSAASISSSLALRPVITTCRSRGLSRSVDKTAARSK